MTTRVRVEPSGIEFDVRKGETIMGAATRSGFRWPTVCGGQADCGVCVLEIVDSPVPLPPPSVIERERLVVLPETRRGPELNYRLACQLRPNAAAEVLVIRKRGVAPIT